MKKCILGSLLAVLLLVSLLPMAALAEEPADTLTVLNFDDEPVLPGPDTYEEKDDGFHVYSSDITFSGTCDKPFFIEGPDNGVYFKNMLLKNSVFSIGLADSIILYMNDATIEGNVTATGNGTDELYLCINIENSNAIQGDIVSDGSITVYGWPDARLQLKSARATTMLYLLSARFENMKEDYVLEETQTMTPADESEPITVILKKEAVFPEDEEFVINGGQPFAVGEDYDVGIPIACDEDGVPFDPQPELTIIYYEWIDKDDGGWEMTVVDGKPTKAGTYLAVFHMPESDPYYTGSHFYEFRIVPATPPTGAVTPIVPVVFLLAVSSLGLAVCGRRKK